MLIQAVWQKENACTLVNDKLEGLSHPTQISSCRRIGRLGKPLLGPIDVLWAWVRRRVRSQRSALMISSSNLFRVVRVVNGRLVAYPTLPVYSGTKGPP